MTITLAGPPRADSSYSIDVGQPVDGGATEDSYGIQIDGTDAIQTTLTDTRISFRRGLRACPTAYRLSDDQLTLIASPGDRAFDLTRAVTIDGSSASLQPGEPLLRHPLDAEEEVPSPRGVPLAASPRQTRCRAL